MPLMRSIKSRLALVALIAVSAMCAVSAYFVFCSLASLKSLRSADDAVTSLHSLALARLFALRQAGASAAPSPGGEDVKREFEEFRGAGQAAARALSSSSAADPRGAVDGAHATALAETLRLHAGLMDALDGSRGAPGRPGNAGGQEGISGRIDEFMAASDRLLALEKARVHKSYDLLLVRLGSFPWDSAEAADRIASARDSLTYFLAAEQSCAAIARQSRAASSAAAAGGGGARELDLLEADASHALKEWTTAISLLSVPGRRGEELDLQNARDVVKKHGEISMHLRKALDLAAAGDRDSAAGILRHRVFPVLDGYLLPKISKAYDEFRKDAWDAHGSVRSVLARGTAFGIAFLAALSLVVMAVTGTIVRNLARSVKALEKGAAAIGSGDLGSRIGLRGDDELARVGVAFDRMAADLQRITVSRDSLRDLASEITLAGGKERRKIAGVLHDDVGQKLAFLKMKLGMILAAADETQRQDIAKIVEVLDGAIRQTRSLTSDLSPPVLYELGYEAAVEWLCDKTSRENGLAIDCLVMRCPDPPAEDVRILMFESLREALANVVKHASAARAKVTVTCGEGILRTIVEDDGKGFDPAGAGPESGGGSHWGLFSIRERLERIGGSLLIDSAPGRGTKVTMTAPLV